MVLAPVVLFDLGDSGVVERGVAAFAEAVVYTQLSGTVKQRKGVA